MDEQKLLYLEALKTTKGNISEACDIVEISRQTHYDWLKSDPDFATAYNGEDFKERYKDLIEKKLREKAELGDTTALIFLAKTICKDRGYIERQEIDVTKIPVNWVEEKYNDETDSKTNTGS